MADIKGAILEEISYKKDRMSGINTNLIDRLAQYGYTDLKTFFVEKKNYHFNQWMPEVTYIDVSTITTELEKAVREEKYGIYISVSDGVYAFHGSDEIDYDLCKDMGICIAELYYSGGTIIGNKEDLGIEIVAPADYGFEAKDFIQKVFEIISKYVANAEIAGNDILINGEKVMGSMSRHINNTFVWAAQISFADNSEYIKKVCKKKPIKKPSYIKSDLLTKEVLESEVVKWLQKQ